MDKKILLIYLCLFPFMGTAQEYFIKGYGIGIPASNRGWGLEMDEDGFTIATGSLCWGTESCFAIIRTDLSGNELWTNRFEYYPDRYRQGSINSLLKVADGNLLISGAKLSDATGDKTVWLMKMNMDGDTLWKKYYHDFGTSWPESMLEKENGNILLCSYGDTSTVTNLNWLHLMETDPDGNLIWSQHYKEPFRQRSQGRLREVEDGNLLVAHRSELAGTAGQTDSVQIGYDATATYMIDEQFGEEDWSDIRLDSNVLDVRVGQIAHNEFQPCESEYIYVNILSVNPQILIHNAKIDIMGQSCDTVTSVPSGSHSPPLSTIFIRNDALPVTISWDSNVFTDTCTQQALITDWHPLGWFDVACADEQRKYLDETDSFTLLLPSTQLLVDHFGDTLSTLFVQLNDWNISSHTHQPHLAQNFNIFPNPAKDLLYLNTETTSPFTATFYTLDGRLYHTTTNTEIDIAHWPEGLYLIKIEMESGGFFTKKILKE